MGVDDKVMRSGLPQGAILPGLLPLFQSGERALHPNTQWFKPNPLFHAVGQPAGVEQHMIDQQVVARLQHGGDGTVHAKDELVAHPPTGEVHLALGWMVGGNDLIPERAVEVLLGQHPQELVDAALQVRLGQAGLQGVEDAGFARAGGTIE
jgi:hypothetical protein